MTKCFKGKKTCNQEGHPGCYTGEYCKKEDNKRNSPTKDRPVRKKTINKKSGNLYKLTNKLNIKKLEDKLLKM